VKLVLIRHARAEDRALLQRDHARALTPDGRRRMRKASKGLQTLLPGLDVLATSPLVRAQQTAEVIARSYGNGLGITRLPALAPEEPVKGVLAWLHEQPMEAVVALVGHEPDLGRLTSWLLAERQGSFMRFKKGAAALLDFDQFPRAGNGTLVWFLTGAQLAELA
jgi:phosphohistidine phosphatase